MLFPESTYIGKRIPKEGFYSKADLNATQKRAFVEDIESIVWRNLLSENTINVSKGEKVTQIDIIQINLKRREYNKTILDVIEKAIPRHLVFILTINNSRQLCINYKEEFQKGKYKIVESFSTDWLNDGEAVLNIQGHDLDRVYENFVYQVAKGRIIKTDGVVLSETIQKSQETEKIKKRIAELEEKKRKEKQFNMQLRIADEIKELKSKIEI